VVVTRQPEQAAGLADALRAEGAQVIEVPLIEIAPPADATALRDAVQKLAEYDWLVFTSANAVDAFMRRLLALGDIRDLKGVRICAIGPSTAERVSRLGIRIDLMPEESRAEAVVEALTLAGDLTDQRILLPRADIAREVIADELRAVQADVTEVIAYRTLLAGAERDGDHDVYRMLLDRQIDAVTFTSASTVRNFAQIFGQEQTADLLSATVVASIGPVTAEAAQQLGIETHVMPKPYPIPDLVDALVDHFSRKPVAP